jgi:hypothetical protein
MFSHPLDPPSVKHARQVQLAHIERWVREASAPWADQRERMLAWDRQQQRQRQQQRVGAWRARLSAAVGQLWGGALRLAAS